MSRLSGALIGLAGLLALPPSPAQPAGEPVFVDVRQGTDLSLATQPGLDFIVIELLGRLWRLPVTGGAATPLTPPNLSVRHPRLSHDGDTVVYQRLGDTGWDIWTLDLDTSTHTQITDDPGNEREPDFLADNDGIVFSADRSGQYDLWSVAGADAPWQPVTSEIGDARFAAVADNGAIVYIVEEAAGATLRTRAAGLTRSIYTTSGTLGPPSWRPGGGVIVFQERSDSGTRLQMALLAPELLIRELNAGEDLFASRVGWLDPTSFFYAADGQIWRRRLASQTRQPVHLFATAVIQPPERPRIALETRSALPATLPTSSTRDGSATVFAAAGDIWLYRDADPAQLTRDEFWNTDPLIDAEGRFVVFARDADGERRLWRLALDEATTSNGSPQALTPPGRRVFAAALDASGSRLAYLGSESGFSRFAPARLHTRFVDDGSERSSAVSVRALGPPRWLADNRVATLSLETLHADGTPRTTLFDATLRVVEDTDAARSQSPQAQSAAVAGEIAAPRLPGELDTRAARGAGGSYVIQAGRVFDGIGTNYLRHVDIHIESGRIVAVVARGRRPLPLTVIDATELTVMPGLIDLHVHDSGLLGELAGRAWLSWGVTTVRSLGPHTSAQRGLSAAWDSGMLPGPRFVEWQSSGDAAAPPLTLRPPALIDDPFVGLPGETPGIDFLSSLLPPLGLDGRAPRPRRFSPAYSHYQDVFALLTASGATELTSLAAFAPAATERLLQRDAPTRAAFAQLFSRRDRVTWRETPALVDGVAARQQVLTRLLRAGGQVAIGTESPLTPPGLGLHVELGLLADAGVANDQVLRSATSTAALALGLETEIGTIEAGRRADLVIVAGDPLSQIADALAIRAIVRDGEWLERDALLRSAPGN